MTSLTVARSLDSTDLARALGCLPAVSLVDLDTARLHDRVESKVILRQADICQSLVRLRDDYHVLEHDGLRTQRYETEYFDDRNLRSYHDHHNQKLNRAKVRYRTYVNSDLTYLEIKRAVRGRTIKDRRRSERPVGQLSAEDGLFVFERTGWDPRALTPSITVSYDRILLVRNDFSERVTIDLNVRFVSDGEQVNAHGLAICEFKQSSADRRSPAVVAMERRPQMFSKYCMGLASCHPTLRRNRFKKVFLGLSDLGVSLDSSHDSESYRSSTSV